MQSHYVCLECRTVSKLPGNCQNDNCIKQGLRTSECHCEDGKHDMLFGGEGSDNSDGQLGERQDGFTTTTIDLDNDEAYN